LLWIICFKSCRKSGFRFLCRSYSGI